MVLAGHAQYGKCVMHTHARTHTHTLQVMLMHIVDEMCGVEQAPSIGHLLLHCGWT